MLSKEHTSTLSQPVDFQSKSCNKTYLLSKQDYPYEAKNLILTCSHWKTKASTRNASYRKPFDLITETGKNCFITFIQFPSLGLLISFVFGVSGYISEEIAEGIARHSMLKAY